MTWIFEKKMSFYHKCDILEKSARMKALCRLVSDINHELTNHRNHVSNINHELTNHGNHRTVYLCQKNCHQAVKKQKRQYEYKNLHTSTHVR